MSTTRKQPKRKSGGSQFARFGRTGALPIQLITVKPDAPERFDAKQQVERVVGALGNKTVARILGVSESQPTRWKQGVEQMSPVYRERLSELDFLLDRLLQVLWPDEIGEWLTTPDAFLNGGRPIDVFVLGGSAPVIAALKAQAQGGYL